jgi:hypothetical protein
MSTPFFNMETCVSENCSIFRSVNSLRKRLAETIGRKMEQAGYNANEIERRSRSRITAPGVRKVLSGESGVLVETLVTLARAIDTTAPELLAEALSLEMGESAERVARAAGEARLLAHYNALPPAQRRDAEAVVAGLARLHGGGADTVEIAEVDEAPARKRRKA